MRDRLASVIRLLALGAAVALTPIISGTGCARAPRSDLAAVRDPWIAETAERHRAADRLLDDGAAGDARKLLRAVVEAAPPHESLTEARRLALQDTYFRLARLELEAKDARQAAADADAGLAYGTEAHLFVANLLVVRGAAREALEDPRGAADDYHRALVMNEALLHEALGTR
jgi:hypothetical protein